MPQADHSINLSSDSGRRHTGRRPLTWRQLIDAFRDVDDALREALLISGRPRATRIAIQHILNEIIKPVLGRDERPWLSNAAQFHLSPVPRTAPPKKPRERREKQKREKPTKYDFPDLSPQRPVKGGVHQMDTLGEPQSVPIAEHPEDITLSCPPPKVVYRHASPIGLTDQQLEDYHSLLQRRYSAAEALEMVQKPKAEAIAATEARQKEAGT